MRIKIDLFLVFLVFLAFKLSGIITWSWWWVCSPLLLYPTIALLMLILIGLLLLFIPDKQPQINDFKTKLNKIKW